MRRKSNEDADHCIGAGLDPCAIASPGRDEFRVCADPNNLPFSDQNGEGLQNKLARFVARDLGRSFLHMVGRSVAASFATR